jgi:hypothetical protein
MPQYLARRGNAAKNAVMVIVALVILGVAGFVVYQRMGPQPEDTHIAEKQKGTEYRIKLSAITNRQPEKFNTVTMQMKPEEYTPKEKLRLEIAGVVANQAALDELKKIVADNPAPVPVEWNVRVAGK